MKWSEQEMETLRSVYASASSGRSLRLAEVAKSLGRDKANVCRKAREMGLTDQARPKLSVKQGKQLTIFRDPVLWAARAGVITKAYIAGVGHPRGMKGKRHSEKTKTLLSLASSATWRNPASKLNAPEQSDRRAAQMYERIAAGEMRSGYTRGRGGKRADLGDVYFRSSWEANYARVLNFMKSRGEIVGWAYEPKTFCFEPIKRGSRFYTPDFLVAYPKGISEWHEVKGWMDQPSRTRLKRMAKYFPEEVVRVIDAKWFKAARVNLAGLIPGWEK